MLIIYIIYKIHLRSYTQDSDLPLENPLFGSVELTKNDDPNKQSYSRHWIWFTRKFFVTSW